MDFTRHQRLPLASEPKHKTSQVVMMRTKRANGYRQQVRADTIAISPHRRIEIDTKRGATREDWMTVAGKKAQDRRPYAGVGPMAGGHGLPTTQQQMCRLL